MFRFENPYIFFLLFIVLFLVLLFIYGLILQRKRLKRFGNPKLLKQLMPNVSYVRPQLKFYLVVLALVLIVVALARPQFGTKLEQKQTTGVEAMVLMDVSNSMMATDLTPSRMENSKLMVSKLVDNMQDDRLGLIVFAGDAYIQLPLTTDNVSAKMFLSNISTNSVPTQGTAIGTAIDLAIKSFGASSHEVGRTIILITDGENHEDNAVEAAKLARDNGIIVNVVGVGSPAGSPIPIPGTMSFWKDKDDNVVVSKLNESMCREIAQAGGGVYVRADNSNIALRTLSKEISNMQKGNMETTTYAAYDEKYYIFAWIAMFLLFIEFYVLNRQNKRLNKIKWFD